MKKTAAATVLAATIGLSAWTMTAALAVAPTEAPAEPAPVTAPEEAASGDLVIPDWSRDLDNSVSCADAVGTPYMDNVLKEGMPPILDADGDGIMCESNGDDDSARAVALDPWEGASAPIQPGYVFPNCDTAYSIGIRYPSPTTFQFLDSSLDPDGDGMACETNGDDDAAFTGVIHDVPLVTDPVAPMPEAPAPAPAPGAPDSGTPAAEAPAPAAEAPVPAEGSQVEEMPVGGAETGVSERQGRTALFAGGALAALAGAGVLARRATKH